MTAGPDVRLVTTETIPGEQIRLGALVTACAVTGANVLRDVREAITNTVGGNMTRYERVLDDTLQRALDTLQEKARAAGYDGVVGVRVSHPVITDGAIEVVVTGTGYWAEQGR
ncbi:MAG: heavy metal-binding domain-containing protein [Pseudomonadota bacterium]